MPETPLRLAIVFPRIDPSRGGAETYVADLARSLVDRGHETHIVTESAAPGSLPSQVHLHPIQVPGLTRTSRIRGFASASEQYLREHEAEFDCVIGLINTWHQDILIPQGGVHPASRDCNALRFPTGLSRSLYRIVKRLSPRSWLYDSIERRQYDPARPTRVVAVSRMVRGHLQTYRGVAPDRVHVIPNAIDVARLAVPDHEAVRRAKREALGLAESDLVGLFVAHNFRLKGLEPLLRSLAERQARSTSPRPVHLLVCGRGKLKPFRAIVDRLGLSQTVHLLGFEPDVRAAFHAADFFVLPSYYDPCSLVVFEALACGLPVITTAQNGAGEVMTQGVEGFVVSSPNARSELIAALDALADDQSRAAMSTAAQKLGREQTLDRHVDRFLEVAREVAAEKRRRPAALTARAPHIGRASSTQSVH